MLGDGDVQELLVLVGAGRGEDSEVLVGAGKNRGRVGSWCHGRVGRVISDLNF